MALKSFNVERQAYHGGSFIGNHVHKALQVLTFIICKSYLVFLFIQPENIEIICKSVILTAASISNTAIQRKAQEIHDKFVDVFVHCHKIYDSSKLLTDTEIDTLGMIIIVYIYLFINNSHIIETAIDTFLSYYRETFTTASFLPKMHMLEDHIVPWMKRWKVGCRCMGSKVLSLSMQALIMQRERTTIWSTG